MEPSKGLLWKIYTTLIGTVTTIVAQKAITKGWEVVTGEEPPEPGDPDTPLVKALTWALAWGVGVGVVQLLTNRFAVRRFQANLGSDHKPNKVKLSI